MSAHHEPYFTVLTDARFLRASLTDESKREFFSTGDALVDFVWRTIQLRLNPDFAATAILEYGCGPGRLAIPLARRAARRAGRVTAVDSAPEMLRTAAEEAAAAGVDNIELIAPERLPASQRFDLVVCYLVLQRLPVAEGLALVRSLLARVVAGGVAVIQLPNRSSASALVSGARWIREHVPAINAATNVVRGRSASLPFVPTHTYALDDVLDEVEAGGFTDAHLTFDEHAGASSVMLFAERPLTRRQADGVSRAAAAIPSTRSEPIDVQSLMASTSIDALNTAAEQYFASLTTWEHHLAKPFSGVDEAPWLLTHLAIVLQGLKLTPGSDVLEFGAGTGWLSRFLTQLGCRAILLDVSPTALRIARELYERVPVVGSRPPPEFLVFDGVRIALPDASVDRIVSFHAFHHAPNPAAVVAEFGRVLRPGGLAVFAEPGPTHSQAAQSQFEMRTYGVVENDVDVHQVWRVAQGCGFADLRMMIFHGLPFDVSLERFEDFLRGGDTGAEWLAEARLFLRNVRNFVLVKEGTERDDSRSARGLACDIHAETLGPHVRAGQPVHIVVTITNTGGAVWLPKAAIHGGVSIGVHAFDAAGTLVRSDVLDTPLTPSDRAIQPGERVRVEIALKPFTAGAYVLEVDAVASNVGWFGQLGSRPARLEVAVT